LHLGGERWLLPLELFDRSAPATPASGEAPNTKIQHADSRHERRTSGKQLGSNVPRVLDIPDHLWVPALGFGQAGGLTVQHGSRGTSGIKAAGFFMKVAQLPIWMHDVQHSMALGRKIPDQSGAMAARPSMPEVLALPSTFVHASRPCFPPKVVGIDMAPKRALCMLFATTIWLDVCICPDDDLIHGFQLAKMSPGIDQRGQDHEAKGPSGSYDVTSHPLPGQPAG